MADPLQPSDDKPRSPLDPIQEEGDVTGAAPQVPHKNLEVIDAVAEDISPPPVANPISAEEALHNIQSTVAGMKDAAMGVLGGKPDDVAAGEERVDPRLRGELSESEKPITDQELAPHSPLEATASSLSEVPREGGDPSFSQAADAPLEQESPFTDTPPDPEIGDSEPDLEPELIARVEARTPRFDMLARHRKSVTRKAAVVLMILALLLIGPLLVRWSMVSGVVSSIVKEKTGKDMSLAGNFSLRLLPYPRVHMTDVHLLNGTQDVMTIGDVYLDLSLSNLMIMRIKPTSMELSHLAMNITRDGDGKLNWERPQGQASTRTDHLNLLKINDGQVVYQNDLTHQKQVLDSLVITSHSASDQSSMIEGSFLYQGVPMTLRAQVMPASATGASQVNFHLESAEDKLTIEFTGEKNGDVSKGHGKLYVGALRLIAPIWQPFLGQQNLDKPVMTTTFDGEADMTLEAQNIALQNIKATFGNYGKMTGALALNQGVWSSEGLDFALPADAILSLKLAAPDETAPDRQVGEVNVTAQKLPDMLAAFGLQGRAPMTLAGKANVVLDKGQVALQDMDFDVNGQKLYGNVAVSSSSVIPDKRSADPGPSDLNDKVLGPGSAPQEGLVRDDSSMGQQNITANLNIAALKWEALQPIPTPEGQAVAPNDAPPAPVITLSDRMSAWKDLKANINLKAGLFEVKNKAYRDVVLTLNAQNSEPKINLDANGKEGTPLHLNIDAGLGANPILIALKGKSEWQGKAIDTAGDIRITGDLLSLDDYHANWGDSKATISGQINFSSLSSRTSEVQIPDQVRDDSIPYVNLTIKSNQVILDDFIADDNTKKPADAPLWSDAPMDVSDAKLIDGNINVAADKIQWKSYVLRGAKANAKLLQGSFKPLHVEGEFADGPLKIDITMTPMDNHLDWGLNVLGADTKLKQFSLPGITGDGVMQSNLNLTAQGKSTQEILGNLSGQGHVQISGGAIKGISLADIEKSSENYKGIKSLNDSLSPNSLAGSTPLKRLDIPFDVKAGVIQNHDDMSLEGSNWHGEKALFFANLPQKQLDLRSDIAFTDKKDWPPIGVRWAGDFKDVDSLKSGEYKNIELTLRLRALENALKAKLIDLIQKGVIKNPKEAAPVPPVTAVPSPTVETTPEPEKNKVLEELDRKKESLDQKSDQLDQNIQGIQGQ